MEKIAAPTKLLPLEQVLTYQNDNLIYKFMENWALDEEETRDLFEETKKWLWISALSIRTRTEGGEAPVLMVSQSMILMDEMWHSFILFTRDYQAFCKNYLGFYLNHSPTTKAEKDKNLAAYQADPDAFRAKQEEQLEAQYSYIYDKLGEETLVKWYSDWTDKFTPDYLDSIHKNYWSAKA